jgi:hypothetical protein
VQRVHVWRFYIDALDRHPAQGCPETAAVGRTVATTLERPPDRRAPLRSPDSAIFGRTRRSRRGLGAP